ncbi:metallophosphoesterase [bacterium]|nr:metallophosphoesterase [bacterium]
MNFSKARIAIALVVVLGIVIFRSIDSRKNPAFRFVFMTDIHVTPDKNADEGLTAAVAYINRMKPKPDFVITGGDLVIDALGRTPENADSLNELYQRIMSGLEMPVYNCIGNHDNLGVYRSSGVDPDYPRFGAAFFTANMGLERPYYSFDHEKWHFVLLNSIGITGDRSYTGHFDAEQLEWLKQDLKGMDPESRLVLVSHIPLYSVATFFRKNSLAANTPGLVTDNSHEVMAICEPYQLKLVLQGHLHIVEDIGWKGTRFITGGAVSGAWWDGPYYGFEEGFVTVDVSGDDFTWKYESYGWDAAADR